MPPTRRSGRQSQTQPERLLLAIGRDLRNQPGPKISLLSYVGLQLDDVLSVTQTAGAAPENHASNCTNQASHEDRNCEEGPRSETFGDELQEADGTDRQHHRRDRRPT